MAQRAPWIVCVLLLGACASDAERAKMTALYNKYDAHCKEHAKELTGEKDEQIRYEECMNYFVGTDVNCPHCIIDPHLTKK